MTVAGIDIAWARPIVAEIKASGAEFVARYFSEDPTKNLRGAEVTAYREAGLGTVVVWETTAGRATAGHAAGVEDALAAEVQRKAVGLPADMVVHFAVDKDVSWAAVSPYFDGVISVIGLPRVGCYGGIDVIVGAYTRGIRFLWQTVAWSEGRWSEHATIRQPGGTTLHGGADWDTATVPDYGQYPRPATPQEDDVTFSAADAKTLLDTRLDDPTQGGTATVTVRGALWAGYGQAAKAATNTSKLLAQTAALSAAVQTLAALVGKDVDTATVVAAVQKAIADTVIHVDVDVTAPQPAAG